MRMRLLLGRDPTGRFLPWMVAFMVFLATLASIGAMAAQGLTERWTAGLSGSMTVQLPRPLDETERDRRLDLTLNVLKQTPGVSGAEILSEAQMRRLLEPWIGPEGLDPALPIPDLIAVTLQAGAEPDLAGLRARLAAVAPGASADDHRTWRESVGRLAERVRLVAAVILAAVLAAAVATVVFATRTGLAIHRRVVELLHVLGAEDRFVAAQFQIQAFRLACLGGVAGAAVAIGTVLGTELAVGQVDPMLMPHLSLDWQQWAGLALLPLAAALVAMATAGFTVLRALGRAR
jgi:cell division transport system permease protein